MKSPIISTGVLLATVLAVSSLAILIPAADACAASITAHYCKPLTVEWGDGSIDAATLSSSNQAKVTAGSVINNPETGRTSFVIHCVENVDEKHASLVTFTYTYIDPGGKIPSKVKNVKLWVTCARTE